METNRASPSEVEPEAASSEPASIEDEPEGALTPSVPIPNPVKTEGTTTPSVPIANPVATPDETMVEPGEPSDGGEDTPSSAPIQYPVQHRGETSIETLAYVQGTALFIAGTIRNLELEKGADSEVEVRYEPVVDLVEGRSASQVDATLAQLEVSVTETNGSISIEASRTGDSNVAATIQVRIPDDFDGAIIVDQDADKTSGGEFEFSSLGRSTSLDVRSASISTDVVVGNVSLLQMAVIEVEGLSDILTGDFLAGDLISVAMSTEGGDILTGFGAVPSEEVDVHAGGDLTTSLPGSGNYTMMGQSAGFSFGSEIPAQCAEARNTAGGSLTCGEGSDLITFLLSAHGALEVDRFVQ